MKTTVKLTKPQQALFTAMEAGKLESKKQQDLIFKILNGSNTELISMVKSVFADYDFEGLLLSDEQNKQAIDYLENFCRSPVTGYNRKNNPFGYRKQDAIENFSHCTLKGYYDAGNYNFQYLIPIYDVYTKDGYGFEYYVNRGVINIT